MRRTGQAVAWLCVLVLATSVTAQEVTIDVADVTVPEAVKLLRDMTGAQIVGEGHAKDDTPRVTLKFKQAPLKKVIKELCRQAGWHYFQHRRDMFHLMVGERREPPIVHVEGYEISVPQVTLRRSRSLDFTQPEGGAQRQDQLSLSLAAEGETDGANDALYAFHPAVRAVTDTGEILPPTQVELVGSGGMTHRGFLEAHISVELPTAEAGALKSLEGELMLYAQIDRAEFEFTLDEAGDTKTEGDIAVTFNTYNPQLALTKFELVIPAPPEPQPGERQVSLQPRCTGALVSADGAQRPPYGTSSSGDWGNQERRFTHTFQYADLQDFEPVKVQYSVTIPRDPSKVLKYRFENIPLPAWEEE